MRSTKRLKKLQEQAKKLRGSSSSSTGAPLGLAPGQGISSGSSFIRLHKEKPAVPTLTHEDAETEYTKALRSEHRKLSMQCILTYTTLFSSFQSLFNTGKASLTRISPEFDKFDALVKKYDVNKRFPGRVESPSRQKRNSTSISLSTSLGDDVNDDEIDCAIDSAINKSDSMLSDSSSGTIDSPRRSNRKLRLSLDLNNESLSSKGSVGRQWDCGSSSAAFSNLGEEEEEESEMNEEEWRKKHPFTTDTTAKAMLTQLVERESKYMLNLTLLSSLHNKLNSIPELSKGACATSVESMFSKLPMLVDAEIALSNKLNSCLLSQDPLGTMHTAFESCKEGLMNAYPEYIRNYSMAYMSYRRIKKRPYFSSAVRAILGNKDLGELLAVPCGHVHDLKVLTQGILEGVAPLATPPEPLVNTISIIEKEVIPPVTKAIAYAKQAKTFLRIKTTVSGADNRLFEPVRTFIYDGTVRLSAVSPARAGRAIWPEDSNKIANTKLIPGYDYHLFVFSDTLLICRDTRSSPYSSSESSSLSNSALDRSSATHSRSGSNLSLSSSGRSNSSSEGGFSSRSVSSDSSSDTSTFGSDDSDYEGGGSLTSSSGGGGAGGGLSDSTNGTGGTSRKRRYEVCAQFAIANVEASESAIGGKPISMPSAGGSGAKCGAKRFILTYKTNTYAFVAHSPALCSAWVKCIRYAAGARAATQVFGVPLNVVMNHECESDNDIPSFLRTAFSVFENSETACLRKGLFRVSSNELLMMQLQARIDSGEAPSEVLAGSDPLLVANMIKKWFHMLPKAIIFFEDFSEPLESKDLNAFKELIDTKMTPTERYIAKALFETLRRIEDHKKENEMNLHNLCVVTAPFLIRPKAPSSAMLCSGTSASIVKFIFKNFDFLFKDVTFEHPKHPGHMRKRSQTHDFGLPSLLLQGPRSKGQMPPGTVPSSPLKNIDTQAPFSPTSQPLDQSKKKKKKLTPRADEKEGCEGNSEQLPVQVPRQDKKSSKKSKDLDDFSSPQVGSSASSSSSRKKSGRSRSKTMAAPN